MRLKIGEKLKTASLNSRFTGSKKEERTSTCSLLKILKPIVAVDKSIPRRVARNAQWGAVLGV